MTAGRDRDDAETYERALAEITIGSPQRLSGPIELSEYDPAWPAAYRDQERRIAQALGRRAQRVEHVGSTSVPGLAAKPIIDIVLEVADSADEPAYLPDLEAAGYVLRIREPGWFEHRLLKSGDGTVNLHVFGDRCAETDRMVRFRDLLRTDASDRERYAAAKRVLAARPWTYVQQYADAKTEVIASILKRAEEPRDFDVLPERFEPREGVLIRRWQLADAEVLSTAVAESIDHLRPWMGWIAQEPLTMPERRSLISDFESEWASGGDVTLGAFVDGQVVGGCGLHRRIAADGLELGYWIHPRFTGRGLATIVARTLTGAALSLPDITHVEIHHDRANIASAGVPRKLGYRFIGEFADPPEAPAEAGIECRWRMTEEDWRALGMPWPS